MTSSKPFALRGRGRAACTMRLIGMGLMNNHGAHPYPVLASGRQRVILNGHVIGQFYLLRA